MLAGSGVASELTIASLEAKTEVYSVSNGCHELSFVQKVSYIASLTGCQDRGRSGEPPHGGVPDKTWHRGGCVGSDFVAVTDRQGGRNDSTNDLDTRERLVRAAIEVFLEKGYGGTRVQDIARRAGFTSGALYVHFPSRTALLGEAIMREGQTIMEQLANEVTSAGASGVSPAESLARLSSGEPTSLDLLLLEALALASRSDEAKEVLGQALNGFVSNLMVMIETSRERGDVGDDIDLEALRQIVVSWVFGGVVVKALGLATTSTDSLTHVTRRLLQGIGS